MLQSELRREWWYTSRKGLLCSCWPARPKMVTSCRLPSRQKCVSDYQHSSSSQGSLRYRLRAPHPVYDAKGQERLNERNLSKLVQQCVHGAIDGSDICICPLCTCCPCSTAECSKFCISEHHTHGHQLQITSRYKFVMYSRFQNCILGCTAH